MAASNRVHPAITNGVTALGRRIEAASGLVGTSVNHDWASIPHQRLHPSQPGPPSRVTQSGAGRLLRCVDGWVAVQLPRATDLEAVPAWLALAADLEPRHAPAPPKPTIDPDPNDPWPQVGAGVADRSGVALVHAAALLGLAVARLDECPPDPSGGVQVLDPHHRPIPRAARVVDLSALWAGPLCGAILAAAGLEVTKVESSTRPDGARAGDPALFGKLNHAKAHEVIDLTTPKGRRTLCSMVHHADVVVESSRPRALEQLGINASHQLHHPRGPAVWVSITGYGRGSPRIAFGDDAAVAGGLVDRDADGPRFVGDAIADPLSGLTAAATTLELLARGLGGLVEVSMAGVAAAHAAGWATS